MTEPESRFEIDLKWTGVRIGAGGKPAETLATAFRPLIWLGIIGIIIVGAGLYAARHYGWL